MDFHDLHIYLLQLLLPPLLGRLYLAISQDLLESQWQFNAILIRDQMFW
jgi:hypothetical protein